MNPVAVSVRCFLVPGTVAFGRGTRAAEARPYSLTESARTPLHAEPTKFRIREALANNLIDEISEEFTVGHWKPVLVVKGLLVDIPVKMKWFDRNVRAINRTLQQSKVLTVIARLAADKCFVAFHFTAELASRCSLLGKD